MDATIINMNKSKLSVAQRMGIYMRLRDEILNNKKSAPHQGLCVSLGLLGNVSWTTTILLDTFPEFALFCKEDVSALWFWWNDGQPIQGNIQRNGMRILILQLCIEMIDKTNKYE